MSRTHWLATTLLATTIAFVGCRRDRNRDEAPPTYTSPTETPGTTGTTTDTPTDDTTTTDTTGGMPGGAGTPTGTPSGDTAVPAPAAEPQPNPTAADNLGLTPGPADTTAPALR
ncbi:MAG: hypothetical protein K8M05_27575, partial [Deltaproteobacteria bacterium]|nr:hypothetical protein [Kofleriaceae bacterium]